MTTIVIQGAASAAEVPGIADLDGTAELRFTTTADELRAALPGAEVLLGWDFAAGGLEAAWGAADRLRWIHWAGAGVDALLFPALVQSGVVLTNSRGVFDLAMAEYVLGLVIGFAKRLPETTRMQTGHHWEHRLTERIAGARALVVGVGSIGREIARLLGAAGLVVEGIGRTARDGDANFAAIHASQALDERLAEADYVVAIAPLTAATRGLFGSDQFRAMKPTAHFISMGRGASVDEAALVQALAAGEIAGAALDVFESEPLPAASPFWAMENVVVSPHMSGDYDGHLEDVAALFVANFRRFQAGDPLANVVDMDVGFVPS